MEPITPVVAMLALWFCLKSLVMVPMNNVKIRVDQMQRLQAEEDAKVNAQEMREKGNTVAKIEGLCVQCHTKTRWGSLLVINENVYKGICIKCNADNVPPHVLNRYIKRVQKRLAKPPVRGRGVLGQRPLVSRQKNPAPKAANPLAKAKPEDVSIETSTIKVFVPSLNKIFVRQEKISSEMKLSRLQSVVMDQKLRYEIMQLRITRVRGSMSFDDEFCLCANGVKLQEKPLNRLIRWYLSGIPKVYRFGALLWQRRAVCDTFPSHPSPDNPNRASLYCPRSQGEDRRAYTRRGMEQEDLPGRLQWTGFRGYQEARVCMQGWSHP
ncbi:expressed unknown protein [Seminavis robusta]|uniref:Uncharacterized protein n=1 Tax=Seminavis robusta TaxID=568900 RepID=A0A9N8HHP6_9STRA|nr:expressed unknown protein [Seminavis robusta]|eukprot:Sro548_g164450.1 n/a (324) ;mRNA; r:44978-46033